MQDDEIKLIKMINDPEKLDEISFTELVQKLCTRRSAQFEYDGLTYCQLSGEIIGEKSTIKLMIQPEHFIVVLKDKLKELIKKFCFINGAFEQSFSKIYKINILQHFNSPQDFKDYDIQQLEITDSILQQVYSQEEYQQILKNIMIQTQQIYQDPQMENNVTFECPITKQTYITCLESINLQGQPYSLQGALDFLNNHRDKLFSHQIEYLEKIQKLENEKRNQQENQFEQIIFQCPKTKKNYYTCIEGIKLKQNMYSVEGLLESQDKSDELINSDEYKNAVVYLNKIKKVQKQ
ncbi:unnamed protein product (macronuclear) [Paramecium tetraurelia]|uniref:Uncharacterized protein n=1 Tax=Paramecium tetraurelia TaxID=5888 RepID=A0BUT5_PARTE|nr:uncharacterized protein GSPATT00005548001 [Paramecium tetraurelia]CAK62302.1 unnamed protein product [Paramecium tetraurelia]|eukprot:XP_001429700.1 hypothetical protein (macronuclear) [Paramecium tetraurelia strain d4-2]